MRHGWLAFIAVSVMCTAAAQAEEDGPGRGVARISVLNGDVSVRRGDSGDYIAAAVNGPLVVQDQLVTGNASRAEVQFDWANMLRLWSNTEVRLSELEYKRYQAQVARGTVTLRVLRDTDAEIEVNTPSVSVRPMRKGSYRVTVREDGESEITVRSGEAEIYSPKGVERLHSGKTMLVRGAPADPEFQVVRAREYDEWDRWNDARDRDLQRSRSYEYVSRDIYGADDLDRYGRWVYVPPYGWVWSPSGVPLDWAPYRYGRWSWIDWYGWTWISYDPWGWAPYHYGRWFHHGPYGWCWYPGPVYHRHYWRPALVAFFGWGGGVHLGVGFGSVGWVPLAPYEPFHPWYGPRFYHGYRNPGYIDNSVRIVNNVNITNVYRNARVINAVTGAESGDFVRGSAGRAVRVSDLGAQRAGLIQGALPVAPAAESLRWSDRQVRAAPLPRANTAERFFVHRQPAPVERVAFDDQRRALDTVMRRTEFERGALTRQPGPMPRVTAGQQGFASAPAATAERVGTPIPRANAGEAGWRRVGEHQTGAPAGIRTFDTGSGPVSSEPGASSDGWHRFGAGMPRRDAMERRTVERPAERGPAITEGTPEVRREGQDNWRRFGTAAPGAERVDRFDSPGIRRESPQMNRMEMPRSEPRSERMDRMARPERMDRTESPRMQRQERLFINPPIVRERSFDRAPAPRAGGGEVRSAPAPRGGGEARGGGARGDRGAARR